MLDIHKGKADEIESENVISATRCQQFQCEMCEVAYSTEDKLKQHLCRVTVRNPSFCDLYTKNWILLNRCTFVYHRIKKVEVALLHCNDCTENISRCTEKFPLWLPAQEDETDGVWHLDLRKFLKDGRIDWQGMRSYVKT